MFHWLLTTFVYCLLLTSDYVLPLGLFPWLGNEYRIIRQKVNILTQILARDDRLVVNDERFLNASNFPDKHNVRCVSPRGHAPGHGDRL